MLGFLIDGTFILASELAAIEYLYLNGQQWFKCTGLDHFNSIGEDSRAIRFTLKNGYQILSERPKSIKRDDMNRLMV